MPPIVTFIGWHDSGKTTLAAQVVRHLKQRGYRVAVIKHSKETSIVSDQPGTDTWTYQQAQADGVTLIAPDQMVMWTGNPGMNLITLAHRFFPEMDIVIGEGFKQESHVAKIEVARGEAEPLRNQVNGVIAVATDQVVSGNYVFRLDESQELADFIEKRFLDDGERAKEQATLLVNGTRVPMKEFVQQSLAATVAGFVSTLKATENMDEIELRIKVKKN